MNLPFYIARRYFLSKNNTNIVNIITSITVLAIVVGAAAMLIVLSVFSGLERMNLDIYTKTNPDLRITPIKGKILPKINELTALLDKNEQVANYVKSIEEKVYLTYNGKEDIALIKGVEVGYEKVIRIDTAVKIGQYLPHIYDNELLFSAKKAFQLSLNLDYDQAVKIYMPKIGKGLITREEDAFNTQEAYVQGIFSLNEVYDELVYAPISFVQNLLELDSNSAYLLEVQLKEGISPEEFKKAFLKKQPEPYKLETKREQSGVFIKVMNTENFIIYLIFTLIIVIAYFTLAGAIIVIIVDKKKQITTFTSMGMNKSSIKKIFFNTGIIIVISGTFLGILLASALLYLQQHFGLFTVNELIAYPVEFKLRNYAIVCLTTTLIGLSITYFITQFNKKLL